MHPCYHLCTVEASILRAEECHEMFSDLNYPVEGPPEWNCGEEWMSFILERLRHVVKLPGVTPLFAAFLSR